MSMFANAIGSIGNRAGGGGGGRPAIDNITDRLRQRAAGPAMSIGNGSPGNFADAIGGPPIQPGNFSDAIGAGGSGPFMPPPAMGGGSMAPAMPPPPNEPMSPMPPPQQSTMVNSMPGGGNANFAQILQQLMSGGGMGMPGGPIGNPPAPTPLTQAPNPMSQDSIYNAMKRGISGGMGGPAGFGGGG